MLLLLLLIWLVWLLVLLRPGSRLLVRCCCGKLRRLLGLVLLLRRGRLWLLCSLLLVLLVVRWVRGKVDSGRECCFRFSLRCGVCSDFKVLLGDVPASLDGPILLRDLHLEGS